MIDALWAGITDAHMFWFSVQLWSLGCAVAVIMFAVLKITGEGDK